MGRLAAVLGGMTGLTAVKAEVLLDAALAFLLGELTLLVSYALARA